MKDNPRFVWIIGSIRGTYPDLPELDGENNVTLWDRQENRPVVTLHNPYGQAFCLETTRQPGDAPFTALEAWLNSVLPSDFRSEGIPGTSRPFTRTKPTPAN